MASLPADFITIGPRTSLFTPKEPITGQLVILCTWLGAARKHIQRYITLYRGIAPGARILLVESSIPITVHSYAKQREAIKPAACSVLHILRECGVGTASNEKIEATSKGNDTVNDSRHSSIPRKPASHILLHVFSNGGTTIATQLLIVLKAHLEAPLPLAGLLCDSCPAKGTSWRSYDAMVLSLPRDLPTRLLGAITCHGILLMLYTWIACGNENPASLQRRTMLDGEIVAPNQEDEVREVDGKRAVGRVCYFYSKEDKMCFWSDIRHHADDARMLGWDVKEVVFEGSGHCAHFPQDEEMYADAVKSIWDGEKSRRRKREVSKL